MLRCVFALFLRAAHTIVLPRGLRFSCSSFRSFSLRSAARFMWHSRTPNAPRTLSAFARQSLRLCGRHMRALLLVNQDGLGRICDGHGPQSGSNRSEPDPIRSDQRLQTVRTITHSSQCRAIAWATAKHGRSRVGLLSYVKSAPIRSLPKRSMYLNDLRKTTTEQNAAISLFCHAMRRRRSEVRGTLPRQCG